MFSSTESAGLSACPMNYYNEINRGAKGVIAQAGWLAVLAHIETDNFWVCSVQEKTTFGLYYNGR